ncbi:MAG TPA: hypothetical protein DCE71_09000 [Parachlamydiales bacterium]|nr:hypothetical protein [Parachlamydiales bacterium]
MRLELIKKIGTVPFFLLARALIGVFIASKTITLPCAIILFLAGTPGSFIQMLAIRIAITGAMIGAATLGMGASQDKITL